MTARQCMAILCLAVFLPACNTFQTYDAGVPPAPQSKVRVTVESGAQIVLHDPQQIDDQYAGGLDDRPWFFGCEDCALRTIPMDSIAQFEVSDSRRARIVGGVLFAGALVAVVAILLKGEGLGNGGCGLGECKY